MLNRRIQDKWIDMQGSRAVFLSPNYRHIWPNANPRMTFCVIKGCGEMSLRTMHSRLSRGRNVVFNLEQQEGRFLIHIDDVGVLRGRFSGYNGRERSARFPVAIDET